MEMGSIDSDFEYMCRTCMRRDEMQTESLQLQSLYDCPLGEVGIVDMLVTTTPQLVTPVPMDGLPQVICMSCFERLVEVQQFQEMCLSSDRCLRGFTNGYTNVDALVEENTDTLEYKYSEELDSQEEEEIQSEEMSENMNITNTELDDKELVEQVDDIIECIEIVEDPLLNDLISAEETPATIGEFTTNAEQFKIDEYAAEINVIDMAEHKEETINIEENQQTHTIVTVGEDGIETDEHKLSETQTFDPSLDDYIRVDGEIPTIEPKQTNTRKSYPQTPCPICSKTFYGKYRMERHLQVHDTDGRPFACTKCEYRFITVDKLKAHETKVHNATHYDLKKTYPCDECTCVLSNESSLAAHKALHAAGMSSEALKYTCQFCGKYFDSNQLLNLHKRSHRRISLMANGLAPNICRYCNKTFQHPRTLQEHIRTHTGEQPYLCFECGKAFNSSSNMKQHLMRHTGELRYECPECPKRFPCLSDLASHKSVHNKVKRQVCDICGAAFVKPYQLKTHKMYHTGDKPHKCEYCEMRFVCADHMRRHMRTHTGEKPYKCKYCDRAFAQSNDLIKHLRSHLGENVYKCELCPSGFRLASELRKHFTQHKNDDDLTRQRNLTALLEEEARLKIKFTSSPAAIASTGCGSQYSRRVVSTNQSGAATSNGDQDDGAGEDGGDDDGDSCHDIASIVESIEQ